MPGWIITRISDPLLVVDTRVFLITNTIGVPPDEGVVLACLYCITQYPNSVPTELVGVSVSVVLGLAPWLGTNLRLSDSQSDIPPL